MALRAAWVEGSARRWEKGWTATCPCMSPQNATYSANDPALRCAVQMDYWIHEMGQFLKEHDAHHMVTGERSRHGCSPGPAERTWPSSLAARAVAAVGQEGFYSLLSRESELRANPVEEHPPECCPWNRYWASKTGEAPPPTHGAIHSAGSTSPGC